MQFGKYHDFLKNITKLEYIIKFENNMNLENIMKFGKYPKYHEIWKISLKFGKYH